MQCALYVGAGFTEHWTRGAIGMANLNICEYCARNDNQSDSESMSVYDAAQIWLSNGKDEDYTFGYSEEELENALS